MVRAHDGSARELYMTITLPENIDSGAVARAIARRAAAYRLRYSEIAEDEHRRRLTDLQDGVGRPQLQAQAFFLYQLPEPAFVSAESAYPSLGPAARMK